MRINKSTRLPDEINHEGCVVRGLTPKQRLERLCMACLLWEDNFYVDGKTIHQNIEECASLVSKDVLRDLAIKTKELGYLRHIPLLLLDYFCMKYKGDGHNTCDRPVQEGRALVNRLITRPDDMAELLALHWRNQRQPIFNSMRRGIADAWRKFDTYQIAKWNRDNKIKLRDVLFLTHPRPRDAKQQAIFDKLTNKEPIGSVGTWENRLSAGENKKESFMDLMRQGRLGFVAFLSNLRLMLAEGVPIEELERYCDAKSGGKILPFQFIAAHKAAPQMLDALDRAILKCLEGEKKLNGPTALLVDVSGSMVFPLSGKSTSTRIDAASGLAIICREVFRDIDIFSFSDNLVKIHPFRGFALSHAIINSQQHGGTFLGQSTALVQSMKKYDRIIVITDCQSWDRVPNPQKRGYMVNIASYKNGVGYGSWNQVDGFSPYTIKYILELEKEYMDN